jgi:hypothetical protein
MVSALGELISSLQSAVNDFTTVLESLAKFRTDISLNKSQLSPQEAYRAAKVELDKNQALVRSGDKSAMAEFSDVAGKFLDASSSYYASSQGYFTDLAGVNTMLTATEAAAKVAKESAVAELTDAERQLEALKEIGSSIKSLSESMQLYTSSVSSAISVDLVSHLRYIDTNGDSTVSLKEMLAKFSSMASESTLNKVFTAIDADGNGQITLLEAIKGNTSGLVSILATNASLLSRMQADYDSWFRTSSVGQSAKIPGSNVTVTNTGNGQSTVTGPSGTSKKVASIGRFMIRLT